MDTTTTTDTPTIEDAIETRAPAAKQKTPRTKKTTKATEKKKTGRAPASNKAAGAWTAPKAAAAPAPDSPAAVKRRAFARLQAGGFTSELITDYLAGDMPASQRWDDTAEKFIPIEALRFPVSDAEAAAAGLLLRHVLQLENQTNAFEDIVNEAINAIGGVKL